MENSYTVLLVHPTAELYGSDRVFLESVSGLLLAGHRVRVSLAASGPLEHELRSRGAKVVVCPSPVLRKSIFTPGGFVSAVADTFRGLSQGTRLIRQLQPDIIYVNTITIPLWNVLARLHRRPLLVHVHEAEASTGTLMRKALALPLFLASSIVANSRFSASVIEGSFNRLGHRIQVVYNAVPGPAKPSPLRTPLRAPVRLAYVGRLSPRKGVDIALGALALLTERGVDAELDLVGGVFPGYEWYEQQLREQVKTGGLEAKVRFCGFQTKIWDSLAGVDIVLVPSRADEPFGNTAVEAILGGRPVIASNTTGLIEATAGYSAATRVPPNDPAALATTIQTVIAHWTGLAELLTADLVMARQRHSLTAYQAHIAAAIERAVTADRTRVFEAPRG